MARILIIEDDITFSQIITGFLKKHGYETDNVSTLKDGVKKVQSENFDLVLLDYRLPDGLGIDLLQTIHTLPHQPQSVVMTSFHDIRTAVKAMRTGAFDYITKPVNPDELLMVVQQALEAGNTPKVEGKNAPAAETKRPTQKSQFVEGTSAVSKQLHEHIELVAPTDISVIIQGESGTGKEQVARTIHNKSKRAGKPFVAIDCGALSTDLAASELFGHVKGAFTGALQDKMGQFEAADGGTLFMDEVGNLTYEVQVKLLRALQEREISPVGSNKTVKIDVRIVTATNDELLESVKTGKFREDLYHRLNEFKIRLTPLQGRGEDLDLFIAHFIEQASTELGKDVKELDAATRALFHRYDWPGNLRELKNIIKRAVLLTKGDTVTLEALPEEMTMAVEQQVMPIGPDLKALQVANEKELIQKTLQNVKYNKSKAAKLLNIDRKTLYYKMAKYNIDG